MERNVAVVTGANSGLGKVTATHLAQAGWHVVLACRSAERGQRALEDHWIFPEIQTGAAIGQP